MQRLITKEIIEQLIKYGSISYTEDVYLNFTYYKVFEFEIEQDLFLLYFTFDTYQESHSTNNGDGDIHWTTEEFELLELEFYLDVNNVGDNPKLKEDRLEFYESTKNLLLTVCQTLI